MQSRIRLDRVIDLADRAVILLLYVSAFVRFRPAWLINPWYIFIMVEMTLMVGFTVFRRWGPITTRVYPVALGFFGTVFLLVITPTGLRPDRAEIGGMVMAIGSVLSVIGALALNRRFGIVPANRGVQDKGPYAIIRHPVYTGYVITYSAFLFTNPTLWNFAAYVGFFTLLLLRAVEEEKFLSEDPAYVSYRQRVKYRVIPGLF